MIRVGTSGWVYPPWRGVFYPVGLAHRRELEYMSQQVNSVEINGSFYSLQRPESFRKWSSQVPDDFVFAVKGPRFVTHMKRLKDATTPVANFLASGVLALGSKLGPVLWQLPPNLSFDPDAVATFVRSLPQTTRAAAQLATRHDGRVAGRAWPTTDDDRPLRHAIEVRHPTFAQPEFPKLLRRYGIALVVADTAGKFPYLEQQTADFTYVRLHGDVELYTSGYTPEALDRWARKILNWAEKGDVYVYFDNDVKVRAPRDAIALLGTLKEAAPQHLSPSA